VKNSDNNSIGLKVGDRLLTIKKRGVSACIVAAVLGWSFSNGILEIWLDRLVHDSWESEWDANGQRWAVRGARVSVLTTALEEDAAHALMEGCGVPFIKEVKHTGKVLIG
jgi:hypothetical protein